MKTVLYRISLLLAIGMLASNCSEDEVPSYGSVYGIITDKQTGEPVSNASITLSPGNQTTATGQDGHYEFVDLEAGQYKIQAIANGYDTNSRQITVQPGVRATGDMLLSRQSVVSKIQLDTHTLNFGSEHTTLSFSIINTGNSGIVSWQISGVESWFDVTPLHGETDMGKSSAVKVTLNRSLIESEKSTTLLVIADGESLPLTVSARPSTDYTVSVSPSPLTFASDESIRQLTITNVDYDGSLEWNIGTDYPSWISSVTPASGNLQRGSSATVNVEIDRSRITSDVSATLLVRAGSKEIPLIVSVTYAQTPSTVFTEASPSEIDFGLTQTTASLTLRAHHGAVPYTIKGGASWLAYSKTAGTIPDFDTESRVEIITLTADRSVMYGNADECTLTVAAGNDVHRVSVSIGKQSGGGDTPAEDYSSATVVSCDRRIEAAIVSCYRSGNSITFTYTLTNNGLGNVNDFRIYPPSSMSVIQGGSRSVITDEQGNEYPYPQMTFRNSYTTGVNVITESFPEDTPCKGTVTLSDVPASVGKITAKIGVYAYPNSTYNLSGTLVQFKNVPVY